MQIPDELLCKICENLMTDAVVIPCCGHSFCDECEYDDMSYRGKLGQEFMIMPIDNQSYH